MKKNIFFNANKYFENGAKVLETLIFPVKMNVFHFFWTKMKYFFSLKKYFELFFWAQKNN